MKKIILALAMSLPSFAVAGVLALDYPSSYQGGTGPYFTGQAFLGNDPMSLTELFADWAGEYRPRRGNNLIFGSARTEAGIMRDGFRIAYIERLDAAIDASRDFVDLVYSDKNNKPLEVGRQYHLDLGAKGFQARGVRLSISREVLSNIEPQVYLGFGASLLKGQRLQDGKFSGQALARTSKDYDFAGILDYGYSRNYLYNLPVDAPKAWGYSFDLGASIRHRWVSVDATINDVLGALYWQAAPYTIANASSENKKYDENGYVEYNPFISGREFNQDLKQNLSPKWSARALLHLGAWEPSMELSGTRGYVFPQVGLGRHLPYGWKISADYETRFRSVGVSVLHKYLDLSFRADDTDLEAARALGVSLGLRLPL